MCGDLHIWEVVYHGTGSEASGEEVGVRGAPECHDGITQLTTVHPWSREWLYSNWSVPPETLGNAWKLSKNILDFEICVFPCRLG